MIFVRLFPVRDSVWLSVWLSLLLMSCRLQVVMKGSESPLHGWYAVLLNLLIVKSVADMDCL
ncbi:hypothetical protein [Lelliottia sp. CFBP8978]|uniref:hypothetical protein n=1 Tax=Lelliottia sp. CFBP8978 TaxID=3096522 RepID=UPI002A6A2C8E|nr:hypothetical protein [Lelliottia sp. CFBP8978]MDY1035639.1 hypothetical protein [Lelliottia sp. CFBP8978]